MITNNELLKYIENPQLLNEDSIPILQQAISEYPYFATLHQLLLINLNSIKSPNYTTQLAHSSFFIKSRLKFSLLLKGNLSKVENHFRRNEKETMAANISDALKYQIFQHNNLNIEEKNIIPEISFELDETINNISEKNEMESNYQEIEHIILKENVLDIEEDIPLERPKISDYLSEESEPDAIHSKSKNKDLIEKFIEEQPRIKPIMSDIENEDISEYGTQEHEEFMTDTLAKIYLKQGNYDKAILAYEKLSLKFPEKSTYFASQIEEIKKLINNK